MTALPDDWTPPPHHRDLSLAAIIRDALTEYLDRQEAAAP